MVMTAASAPTPELLFLFTPNMTIPTWLNFYDIFGYIFPGAIIVGASAVLASALFKGIDLDADHISTAEWALFPFVSYLVGIANQAFGGRFESAANRRIWGEWPSKAFMGENSSRYSPAFRDRLRKIVADAYQLPEKDFDRDGFWLCYSYVVQNGVGRRAEAFLGMSALSRGLIVACLLGAIALVLAAVADTALPPLLAAAVLLLAMPAFFDRWKRSTSSFADAVYRDFYVAHPHKGGQTNAS
jgi:hypothetical protein